MLSQFLNFSVQSKRLCNNQRNLIFFGRSIALDKGSPDSISDREFMAQAFIQSTSFDNESTAKFKRDMKAAETLLIQFAHQLIPMLFFDLVNAIAFFNAPLLLIEHIDP